MNVAVAVVLDHHGHGGARVALAQVTLAEAIPVQGSGITLPLDLFRIAARCNGAYFASKRFAAVQVPFGPHLGHTPCHGFSCSRAWTSCSQLAYTHPRCRVLVFRKFSVLKTEPPKTHTSPSAERCVLSLVADTGRLVGTGDLTAQPSPCACTRVPPCSESHRPKLLSNASQAARAPWQRGSPSRGPSASWPSKRASVCTCATLMSSTRHAQHSNRSWFRLVHKDGLTTRYPSLFAQVGAASLRATLNCEAFAEAHRSEAHFHRASFVGLAVNFKATLELSSTKPCILSMFVCVCAQWRPAGEACCVGTLAHTSNSVPILSIAYGPVVYACCPGCRYTLGRSTITDQRCVCFLVCAEVYSTGRAK